MFKSLIGNIGFTPSDRTICQLAVFVANTTLSDCQVIDLPRSFRTFFFT